MEDEAKSVESVMKSGMRKLLIRVAKRERKNEDAMDRRRGMEKTCLLQRKRFGQAFLKLDAWCESTRGVKKIANSQVGNSQ